MLPPFPKLAAYWAYIDHKLRITQFIHNLYGFPFWQLKSWLKVVAMKVTKMGYS
jgi:hypothetical protein